MIAVDARAIINTHKQPDATFDQKRSRDLEI
jgi:hypothetical protein